MCLKKYTRRSGDTESTPQIEKVVTEVEDEDVKMSEAPEDEVETRGRNPPRNFVEIPDSRGETSDDDGSTSSRSQSSDNSERYEYSS